MDSVKLVLNAAAVLMVAICASCAGIDQVPNAEPGALAIAVEAQAPAGCTALGEVRGDATSTDLANAVRGAKNDMRNAALRRGANFVVIATNNSSENPGNHLQTNVAMTGHALVCPSAK